jgi:hypothetical protein
MELSSELSPRFVRTFACGQMIQPMLVIKTSLKYLGLKGRHPDLRSDGDAQGLLIGPCVFLTLHTYKGSISYFLLRVPQIRIFQHFEWLA